MSNNLSGIDFSEFVTIPHFGTSLKTEEYSRNVAGDSAFFSDIKLEKTNFILAISAVLTHFSDRKKFGCFVKSDNEEKFKFLMSDIYESTSKEILEKISNDIINNEAEYSTDEIKKVLSENVLPVFVFEDEISNETDLDTPVIYIDNGLTNIRFKGASGENTERLFQLIYEDMIEFMKNYDSCKDSYLADIPSMSTFEMELIRSFNEVKSEQEDKAEHILNTLFKSAQKYANDIALEYGDVSVTYEELLHNSCRYAEAFRKRGITKNGVSAILMKRSPAMIYTIIGMWMCGAAYIPIDTEMPDERVEYILSDSKTGFIITDSDRKCFEGKNIIKVEECESETEELHDYDTDLENNAYLIYTSGSTGTPKGVLIGHSALAYFIQATLQCLPFEHNDAVLSVTTCSFDIFLAEIMWPLVSGARLVIASEEEKNDPYLINEKIKYSACNVFQTTPSRLKWMYLCGAYDGLSQIEKILVGGEMFPNDLLKKLNKLPFTRIFNVYGPTESTIWSSSNELTGKTEITIGRPIRDTGFLILDDDMQPVPVGTLGQLCIYGKGLAKGYVNKPELTAERFVSHPLANDSLLYLTGDLACWQINGEVNVAGRNDFQIKINGYRIELGDIESVTNEHPLVKNSAAAAYDGKKGKCIAVVYTGERAISKQEFVKYYSEKIPSHMIPEKCIYVDNIPINVNGKVDHPKIMAIIDENIERND